MLELPVYRWGKAYESLEKQDVVHFDTGEVLAQVHQANGGIVKMDMRKAPQARAALRKHSIADLLKMCQEAGELYQNANLTVGNSTQTPQEFCQLQSASTGLPENMCKANMEKLTFVMKNMDQMIDALTRGLPYDVMEKGFGVEDRGVPLSYQANSPALGLVLPSNSPGVHTLWVPAIPMQIGLVLKPGSSEPWTPYRAVAAMLQAGIPAEAISLYPGPHDVGAAVTETCGRVMVFGGQATVDKYAGNPGIQVHGPGFSKVLIGDDMVDDWESHLDVLIDSVFKNSGRSCINASSIWCSRHGVEIADAIAKKLGAVQPKAMDDPESPLAAFTTSGVAEAMNNQIEEGLKDPSVTEVSAKYRDGDRLVENEHYDFLRPIVLHCTDPKADLANTEYMFPMVSVTECPQDKMINTIGPTLVCSAITEDQDWIYDLLDATHIDRLNIGSIPTTQMNWLQPHEGNIVDFLFRSRAYQYA